MPTTMERLIAVLIAAHAVAEFGGLHEWLLQCKRENARPVLHALIHGTVAYVFMQAWACWQASLCVLLLHLATNAIGRPHTDSATQFVTRQVVQVASLAALVWALRYLGLLSGFTGIGYQTVVAVGGFIATVNGSGYLVGRFTKTLLAENSLELDGLKNGGKRIGQLERALIFVFILTGQPGGIGFLVAAKSILRFEEAKKQTMAEYVLIGTLLSFSLAIALASATTWAMKLKG